ncbi:MAG: OmpA family protein [Bacteroidia bacterium]|nr:OmpA family protein [Bacteroidia bacterium]MBP9688128.1 OmpA family protein [Bacteroidia bacterium]
MRVLFIALYCLFFNAVLFAQSDKPLTAVDIEIIKADQVYMSKKYNSAATMYKRVYSKIKDEEQQASVNFKIAESYRLSNNFKQAFEWYEKLVNTKYPDPKILYSYGLLLKNYERYSDAARQFNDYLFEMPGDIAAIREVEACKIAGEWKLNPQKFSVDNVKQLNTDVSDYAPVITNGKITWSSSRSESTGNIIFEWTGQKCADIFEANFDGNGFGSVTKSNGLINSNYNEGAAWVDSTNTTMYFTQCNGTDGKGLNCKIYVSFKQNNQWSAPQVLPFCSDSFSVGHPTFTADNKRMYFASNMPGSIGEKDIYYIDYNPLTAKWGTPINLGPNVNTIEDDMFPTVSADGKIYFASKGHFGMGGLDLFYTQDSVGEFTKAVNLKSPINSGADDFGITFFNNNGDAQKPFAYYTSNRDGGLGDDDIYSISIKPFTVLVKGVVLNKEDNLPINNAEVIAQFDNTSLNAKTDGKGNFVTELALNKSISLTANKDKFFKGLAELISTENIKADTTIMLTLYLNPIPDEGVEFTLQGIYYDLDKANIRPEAARVLDSLVFILSENPTITIELASHTDSRAPEDYNLKLSQKRAQSCVDYLLKNGINKARLKAVGYGETKLVNDCTDGVECTEEEHQANRRTTFRVLTTDYKGK